VRGPANAELIAATTLARPLKVILRWHVQYSHIAIPKPDHQERMEENLAVFGYRKP
jgi:diketogulonate reductase-like aldo/keto reductase